MIFKYQTEPSTCGANALASYFALLGLSELTEAQLIEVCGTTGKDGTDAKQLKKGIKFAGLVCEEVKAKDKDAMFALKDHPMICSVDQDEHWVTAVYLHCRRARVLVFDGAHNDLVLSITPEEFMARWAFKGKCYGMHVGRKV